MRPFWHPLSALLLVDPPTFATKTLLRLVLKGPTPLLYAGDRMWPAVVHGQEVVCTPLGNEPARRGEIVLVCPQGIPDLMRVEEVKSDAVLLRGDADPGPGARVGPTDILARTSLPAARITDGRRTRRRLRLDLREALTGRPDDSADPALTVRDKYEAQAPYYVHSASAYLDRTLEDMLRSEVPEGGRVLVAGSGTGRESIALAKLGWKVRGVDFSPAMIELARKAAADTGIDVEFDAADLRAHEEERGSLDAVLFTYDVYSFLPDRDDRVAILRKMVRWLRRGGVILLSARRLRGFYAGCLLGLQRLAGGGGSWGASHTRWIGSDGGLRRSFVQVFSRAALRRELREAGLEAGPWAGGHCALRRAAD